MEQMWFTGRFDPPAEATAKNLPRMVGEGSLVTRPDGLDVRGSALMASDRRRTRRIVGVALGALAALALFTGADGLPAVGSGLALVVAWAGRIAWRDRRGHPIDAFIAWEHVEAVGADQDRVVVVLGDARFWGTPVPNPVFFTPDGGPDELVAQVTLGIDASS